tara:strand:- start:10299 stop:10499 length:201 start_codon:yes stop_codon:yes gene_type:complete
MTFVYTLISINFLIMVASWFVSYKIFRRKIDKENPHLRSELDALREDVNLVAKNPSAARRKLNSNK